jgi:CheY-like chemotaxis protein
MTETTKRAHPVDILLVDDNDDDVLMVQRSFQSAKLVNVLQVVGDGEEALAYLRKEGEFEHAARPGLVLLDINMPKKNGFEVLEEMKADPTLRDIPVIMLTTSERDEDVVRSYNSGAATFVPKPVTFEQLKEVMNEVAIYWALVARLPEHH